MIRNIGFSPILYGAVLIGIAFSAGVYVQSTAGMQPQYAQNMVQVAMPPASDTALQMRAPESGPNGLYRGLSFQAGPEPCNGPEPILGCVEPDLLQPQVQNVIVPVD